MKIEVKRILRTGMALLAATMLLASCRTQTKVVRYEDKSDKNVVKEEIYIIETSSTRGRIVEEAGTWIGTPYKRGGEEKGVCVDCSGMVMHVYQDVAQIKLPRTSYEQAGFCDSILNADVLQGDLVFFATGSDTTRVSHVGIMIDHDRFIHASSSSGVKISHVTSPYFQRRLIKYGRVPGLK